MAEKRKDSKGRILQAGESQRPDGRYQFSKMHNKKRYTIYNMDLAELRKEKLKLLSQLEEGGIKAKRTKLTVDDYFQHWLETYALNGRKLSTVQTYKGYYETFVKPAIGDIKLVYLTKSDIQKMINKMAKEGKKSNTIRLAYFSINKALECAVDDDLLAKNPARNITLPENNANVREALEREDIEVFFDTMRNNPPYDMYVPMFTVLFNTGMRISELCALTWEDIDFNNRTICISYNQRYYKEKQLYYLSTPKSKKSIRTIPMNDATFTALKEQRKLFISNRTIFPSMPILDDTGREIGTRDGFVFFGSKNRVMTQATAHSIIKSNIRICNSGNEKKLKLKDFTTHQTRHTFTTLAYDAGIDVKYTSEMLGHASVELTMDRYTHLSEKKRKEQLDKVNLINIS